MVLNRGNRGSDASSASQAVDEVRSAVNYIFETLLSDLVDKHDVVRNELVKVLLSRYEDHWHPEQPERGSAYRCIGVHGGRLDPIFHKAATAAGVSPDVFLKVLPDEFTMWIDPGKVLLRMGASGHMWNIHMPPAGVDTESSSSDGDDSPNSPPNVTRQPSNLNPNTKAWSPRM
eukprot:m.78325 g.78325  ORF g.78325 m.78325 type:complete len:174 (+) comp16224_c0_seq1:154-675(+)